MRNDDNDIYAPTKTLQLKIRSHEDIPASSEEEEFLHLQLFRQFAGRHSDIKLHVKYPQALQVTAKDTKTGRASQKERVEG